MIARISLQNTATFGNETQAMDKLKKLNFVFGSNGSGKTTISRVLRSPEQYPNCTVEWENGSAFPCKVYNSDFVAENFKDDSDMPGIFTLGKEELETKERIRELEKKIRELDSERTKKSNTLKGTDGKGGKEAELAAFEKKYTDIFWTRKQRYDSSSLRDGRALRSRICVAPTNICIWKIFLSLLKRPRRLKSNWKSLTTVVPSANFIS